MTTSAFVFPGQGSQSVGMGQALAAAFPAAAAIFAAADSALGEPISRLAFDGPADVLDRTENAQPALLATSIAYLEALRERSAIEAATDIAQDLGARKVIVLPVSVAAHSPLMAEAADGMRRILAEVEFHDPSVPLLANADARPITTGDEARAELVDHLTAG